MTNLVPYFSAWVLLAASVLGLALYRKFVSAHEEDRYVHVSEAEARLIPHQVAVNRKIGKIDQWGETLTVFTLVTGVMLVCIFLYRAL